MRRTPRDPLAPVEFVATVLLAFNAFLIVMALAFLVFDRDHSTFLGEGDACVDVRNGPASVYLPGGGSSASEAENKPRTPPAGTTLNPKKIAVCAADVSEELARRVPGLEATHPTSTQRWWNRLAVYPPALFGMGALTFVWMLARRARREGFFVASVARGLTWLGVYLAAGSLLTSIVVLAARKQLLDTLLPTGGYWDIGLHLSWSTLLTGAGLVSLGRVMAHAVAMREDLDATV